VPRRRARPALGDGFTSLRLPLARLRAFFCSSLSSYSSCSFSFPLSFPSMDFRLSFCSSLSTWFSCPFPLPSHCHPWTSRLLFVRPSRSISHVPSLFFSHFHPSLISIPTLLVPPAEPTCSCSSLLQTGHPAPPPLRPSFEVDSDPSIRSLVGRGRSQPRVQHRLLWRRGGVASFPGTSISCAVQTRHRPRQISGSQTSTCADDLADEAPNHPANHPANHFGRLRPREQLKTSLTLSSASDTDNSSIFHRPFGVDTAVDTADSHG